MSSESRDVCLFASATHREVAIDNSNVDRVVGVQLHEGAEEIETGSGGVNPTPLGVLTHDGSCHVIQESVPRQWAFVPTPH